MLMDAKAFTSACARFINSWGALQVDLTHESRNRADRQNGR
jgi:hypothetical protein